jgi:ankyrin repeat protein
MTRRRSSWVWLALWPLWAATAWAQPPAPPAVQHELWAAADRGDTAALAQARARGAQLDARDTGGRSALMRATRARQPAAVAWLLNAGADVNLRDDRLDNPLLYAGAEGELEILRLAIAAGANTRLTNRYGGTALIPAAERGHVAVVRELLTRTDVDVNHVNRLGWTALLEAIVLSNGGPRHQQIVALLLDHRADPNLADGLGVTPLQHARTRGFAAIEASLLKAGAR